MIKSQFADNILKIIISILSLLLAAIHNIFFAHKFPTFSASVSISAPQITVFSNLTQIKLGSKQSSMTKSNTTCIAFIIRVHHFGFRIESVTFYFMIKNGVLRQHQ